MVMMRRACGFMAVMMVAITIIMSGSLLVVLMFYGSMGHGWHGRCYGQHYHHHYANPFSHT